MVQSLNWAAIRASARLLRQPSLAVPHVEVATIRDLNFAKLRDAGCTGVVFDKDNTLTEPYVDTLEPSLADALRSCRDAFGDERIAVLSNSAGTPDDPGHASADRLEAALGLPVLRRPYKKPRGFESVVAHFGGADPATLVMVGDRYLTDVVFGNLHGMLCVRTAQLTRRGDNPVAQLARGFEERLVAIYRWLRVRPIPHRMADGAQARFVRRAALRAGEREALLQDEVEDEPDGERTSGGQRGRAGGSGRV